jgi:phosphoesterase RecJ-like protein
MIDEATRRAIAEKLKEKYPTVIYTHMNPDGDAVGSSLALAMILKKLGHAVDVIIPNGMPDFLKWMPGSEMITIARERSDKAKKLTAEAGLMFFLDFNEPDRLDQLRDVVLKSTAFKVLIDHHQQPFHFADITVSRPGLSSVGEMIFRFAIEMGYQELLDTEIATGLYVAIMTDTGNFRYSSSDPGVFHVAGELMKYNIDKDDIFSRIYDSFSFPRMRLLGYCMLEKMVYIEKYRVAYISLTREELERFNYRLGDTEGFVNVPFSIQGVRFTALFIEKERFVKASFRSKGSFSVDAFARKHFNGGGHINAAGGDCPLSMNDTLKKFESLLEDYKDELSDE